MNESKDNAQSIVEKTISYCKKKYWEFSEGLSVFRPVPFKKGQTGALSSDGKNLYYSPSRVISMYENNRYESLSHELMHVLFHMIYGDPEEYRNTRTRKIFNAYSDTRNDIIQYRLEGAEESLPYYYYDYCEFVEGYSRFPDSYHTFKKDRNLSGKMVRRHAYRYGDDHSLWDKPMSKSVSMTWKKIRGTLAVEKIIKDRESDKKNVGMFTKLYGIKKGEEVERYSAANGEAKNYTDTIRQFLKEKEGGREDPETIERMMYSYGFELYDDVALIEPSEEAENSSFGVLGVAIDTSGSCSGDVAEKFLRELSAIFRDITGLGYFEKIILYQCDTEIQKKVEYTDPGDIDTVMKDIDLFGFGGTSFIPVFEDLEKNEKENGEKVDALFYLTDGMGSYPEEKPSFKTFFVIPRSEWDFFGYDGEDIPDWVERLEIRER